MAFHGIATSAEVSLCSGFVEPNEQHTPGHIDCPACDATRELYMFDPERLRAIPFREAGALWLETRRPYLKPRSFYLCGQHIKNLTKFFGPQRLEKIHIGHIREYQKARIANAGSLWAKKAGPSIINHEVVALQQVMHRAGEWEKIKPHFTPLPLPSWRPPKVLSDEEEMRVFAVAAGNPEWQLASWVAYITVNTGASGTELRHLRFSDLHLEERIPCFRIDSETAKNEFRGRMVALNDTALHYVRKCMERGNELGAGRPDHFVFPFREAPGKWDPTRPATASWMRRSFSAWREAAGVPWLTPHCFRHQHITLRYEAGETEQTISLGVGHQSARMTRHYSSLRRKTQFVAVQAIDTAKRFGPQSVGIGGPILVRQSK